MSDERQNYMKSVLNPNNELTLQKTGKTLHRILFRKAVFEENKEGFVINQMKKKGTFIQVICFRWIFSKARRAALEEKFQDFVPFYRKT